MVRDRVQQIDQQLTTSRRRQQFYRVTGDDRSAEIEGKVMDRLLDERNALAAKAEVA